MAELFLIRHGHAEASASGGDAERRLTAEGEAAAKTVGLALAKLDVDPDRLLCSPYRRAQQTAGHIAEALGGHSLTTHDGITPHGHARTVAEELSNLRGTTVLVSHLPFLPELAAELLSAPAQVNFRPATALHLSLVGRSPAFLSGCYDAEALRALLA